mmetsp:Transcript_4830/g.6374  ORF Transcript_4830/g.6374 Transcript_4830/m.6374 type:complete len:430 (+) Transcript_4830:106-1395(+)
MMLMKLSTTHPLGRRNNMFHRFSNYVPAHKLFFCLPQQMACLLSESFSNMVSLGRVKAQASLGSLAINCAETEFKVNVEVVSEWNDEVEIFVEENAFLDPIKMNHDDERKHFKLKLPSQTRSSSTGSKVTAYIPNQFDVDVNLNEGNVDVPNEVKGDVELSTKTGNITVKKLQGANVTLLAPRGLLEISKVAEGNVQAQASQVSAKMLKGNSLHIVTQKDVSVGAIYSPEAMITSSEGGIDVGGVHGNLKLQTSGGDINVHDVNGSILGTSQNGHITAHINALEVQPISSLESTHGNIDVTMTPDLEAHIGAKSDKEVFIKGMAIDGHVTDTSVQGRLIKIEDDMDQAGSGKVDFREAKSQALKGYFSLDSTQHQMIHDSDSTNKGIKNGHEAILPTFLAKSITGSISLSSLSWMDSIQKRFGFLEDKN